MHMRKFYLPLMGMLLLFLQAAAQRQMTGKITDANGNPVPNASVQLKGQKTGTVAGLDGTFMLTAQPDAVLVVTAVGYETQEVKTENRTSVVVQLVYDSKTLTDVVVTGTGVATSRKKIGISVEAIGADKLPSAPTATIDQALVGKIAGAQISSVNGSPGRGAQIVLRGINTVQSSTKPMILVDGIEVRATDINSLDLSGIERVEVVQGGASATIYGAQGANGVIQLFSKKGKQGKINIDVSSSYTVNEILNNGNVHKSRLHPFTVNANNEVIASSGNPIRLDPAISVYRENVQVNLVDVNTFSNKAYDRNLLYYDHYDMFFQQSQTYNNSIRISGASNKIDFSFSASDNRENSVFRNNGDYSRSNLLANIGVELAKGLRFRTTTQLVYTKNTLNDRTGRTILFALNNARPFADFNYRMPDGNYGYYFGESVGVNHYNPNYRTQYSNQLENRIDVVQNFNLNYKPVHWLELDGKYGLNYQSRDQIVDVLPQDDNASARFWGNRWWTATYAPTPSLGTSGTIENYRYRTTFQNFVTSATFFTDFSRDFGINIPLRTSTLVAFDYRKNVDKDYITWGADAPFYTPYTADQMGTFRIALDRTKPFVTYGYLLNHRFEWGDVAGLSGGFRSDYSSAFGQGSKPFTFPRGDVYFRPSTLAFWKNGGLGRILPELKVRAAYGEAGIQPDAFDRYLVLDATTVGSNVAFINPVNSANELVNVEVSKEKEIGVDLTLQLLKGSFLHSFDISATYWDRSTDGAIYDVDVPPTQGYGRIKQNAFGLASRGLQASLNLHLLKGRNLSWNLLTNFSKQTSEIKSVKDNAEIVVLSNAGSSNYVLRAGEKIGQLYGNLLLNNVDQRDAAGNPYIPKAQQANYTLASNGWVVDKATKQPFVTPNKVSFGDPNPKFNMSFINELSWRGNLTFNMQWDWVHGSHLYNQTKEWMYRDGIHGDYAIPVTIDGKTEAYTAFYRGVYAQVQANGTKNYFYEDASFMRLRNLSVAYDFAKMFKSSPFQRLQLVLTGRNLVTFTNYTGFDPETSSGTLNSPFDRGVDHNTVPNLRSYQIGLNIGF